MGDNLRNPRNLRFKTGSDEATFSFSYPDNKFQIDKIQFVEYKSQDFVIKKKNRHKHLDYGIKDVSSGSGVVDKFHERNQIKYEETKQQNKAKHKINYECKIAGGKKSKKQLLENMVEKNILNDNKTTIEVEDEYFSEPELEMDFNDLFELSISQAELDNSSSSEDED